MKTANKIVMSIAGAVLIIASVLKVHQLLTEPIISAGFWESWLFTVIQIPLEMGLGIWLVSGLFRKAGWLLSLVAFAGFIGITIAKWWTGAASCGCFGVVLVKPWITLTAIDIPLFVLLAIFRPKGERLLPPPWPSAKYFFGVAVPTFFILGTIVPVLVFNKPPDVADKYEVIKPQTWLAGKNADPNNVAAKWPLLAHIDIADKISVGFVIAFLYHYDCPECRQAIPDFEQINQSLSGNPDITGVAFIEIPPYGSADQNPVKPDTSCLTGRLDTTKTWYVKTPLIVLLKNGSPIYYWQEETPNLEQIGEKIAEHQ
jgi:thiol-disulfide isomerase/thioredoxin